VIAAREHTLDSNSERNYRCSGANHYTQPESSQRTAEVNLWTALGAATCFSRPDILPGEVGVWATRVVAATHISESAARPRSRSNATAVRCRYWDHCLWLREEVNTVTERQKVEFSDGTRASVSKDDDGRIRLIVKKAGPMVMEQLYMTGEGKDAIVVLSPR
jgi:hypothetical protein